MALEHRLIQTQSQKLILSPQIKQYIKLLPLPITELQNAIEQEIAENPALEEDLTYAALDTKEPESNEPEVEKNDELDFQETFEKLEQLDEDLKSTLYSDYGSKLESLEDLEKKHNYRESLINKASSLSDYLLWQLNFLELSSEERKIAEHIVGNLDTNGYLTISCDEVAKSLETSADEVKNILSRIQTLDPAGVGAQNLQECLLIQLQQHKANPYASTAMMIIKKHFKLLEKRDYPTLTKALSASDEKIKKTIELITSLEPKPGRIFVEQETTVITPDASVYPNEENDGTYTIEIHDEHIPQLRINKKYRQMLKDPKLDKKTKDYLKSKINAAFWFMKAVDQRKSTLREITEKIITAQEGFFERGFSFLKPLRLRDIAEQIGIHESTISRAISEKYINTPQGTIPYKMFFSNKMETDDGAIESQKSIMEKIRLIIENEDPKNPHSDAKLVSLLTARGIKIARRTVAKYRELLKFLPSHMRRKR